MNEREYFQDYMPGDVCFGCGGTNAKGLRIRSYWEGEEGVCEFRPEPHHQGWPGVLCGGIIATVVDCHCMATAMATAIRNENRPLSSEPKLRFATGTLNVKYLKPAPLDRPLQLRAHVTETKDRKYTLACNAYSDGTKTAEATVIALLVYRSDQPQQSTDKFRGSHPD